MLEHGGGLRAAARVWGTPLERWLDLSTGINPQPYPVPPLGVGDWARLPEPEDGLEAAAAACYGTRAVLPVAGSQPAIQALPRLFEPGRRVLLAAPTYAEHGQAWSRARHELLARPPERIEDALDAADVVVLVQPNNPTGQHFGPARLAAWLEALQARGATLVVDEAFADAEPAGSLAHRAGEPGLVLLRSLGKFFGLAGARVGCVLAEPALRDRLAEELGPWAVSGPARAVARAALADRAWQAATRARLAADSARLARLLADAGLPPAGGTTLFQWVPTPRAEALQRALAERAILVRCFAEPPGLRFGLPGREADWVRLARALDDLRRL